MFQIVLVSLLILPALFFAIPVITDAGAWLAGRIRGRRSRDRTRDPEQKRGPLPRLLFLVPAHDEEKLIERAVRSLRRQRYPSDRMKILVVADNCSDGTAALASAAGAEVLERSSETHRGKHHAIGWALDRVELERHGAVVIVDADTIVERDYARQIARHAPLERCLVQTRVGASNEEENWLTRMSALLTRCRWDLALPLKERAGLNCPLTGDGTVLGTAILRDHPWRVETITEGWELYARFTLAGLKARYEPRARIYAQEAHSLDQSRSQRERWTAGRLAVLRLHLRGILTTPGIRFLQRLDLIAELSSMGPMMRVFVGLVGANVCLALGTPLGAFGAVLFLSPVLQTGLYALISLMRHPDPTGMAAAFLKLPVYMVWRVGVGVQALFQPGTDRWIRTERHEEA